MTTTFLNRVNRKQSNGREHKGELKENSRASQRPAVLSGAEPLYALTYGESFEKGAGWRWWG